MKKLKKLIKNNKLIFFTVILYAVTFFVDPLIFFKGLEMTKIFLIQMIEIMPPIFVISSLITVWVPPEVIAKGFGKHSGFKGKLLSVLIGGFSAGPIYAAFPLAQSLFYKGASVSNTVIILSSWAVIKVVMFMVESSFLGLTFALTRYALTIPLIIIMGYVMEKFVSREEILNELSNTKITYKSAKEVLRELPNMNCGACGYRSCRDFAEGVMRGEVTIDDCAIRKRAKLKEDLQEE
jgi:uncharacterized membrane protein YraQ (UPF0718 family)